MVACKKEGKLVVTLKLLLVLCVKQVHAKSAHLDKTVQLFITTNGQLKMPGCDTLHL